MKITQWLGYNEESSQYLLRRGELRALVNLHPRRPGMLVSRPGIIKLYGKYDDESIFGLFRRDTLVGDPSDFLCFQKVEIPRVLTQAQIAAKEFPTDLAWIVRRIQGNQERVIAQLPISPNGKTQITNFCVAEDRHGRLFMFFGHGAKPEMYRPSSISNSAIDMGLDAPKTAPSVTPSGEGWFLEAVDVLSGGGAYWGPPTITVEGGNPDRQAKVKAIVQSGNVVAVEVLDGGANYKSFPKIVVGSDRIGSGFLAVGNLETDPGVQGFVGTTPGVIGGTAPSATETVGSNNSLTSNKIMYLSSPVTATTRSVPQAAASTNQMVLQSISGISVGDIVTIYSGTIPAEFTSTAVFRVLAINTATKTLTLSKTWTPAVNTSYFVQTRKGRTINYADATWDSVTRRFRASVPLLTTKGSGEGAQATLEFTPASNTFGLGAFTRSGYTVPTGPTTTKFAYRAVGWDNYINDEYWQGSFQNKKDSAENLTYAGIQASGKSLVLGYTGTISTKSKSKAISRRADVYWPDYSAVSVWLCTGQFSDATALNQWTRQDATVYEDVAGQPYAIVELRPAVKSKTSVSSGRRSKQTADVQYATAPGFRYPKVRINLRRCPDAWITSIVTEGNANLPSSVKEEKTDRLAWWHSSGRTPKPIVDFRGSGSRLDYATIEVIDPGAGWEKGTVFGLRVHQANPYVQQTDYNVATSEARISGSHAPFSQTARYAQFAFEATEADDLAAAGPPNALVGGQYVDVGGSGYRSGDTAQVTLLKRRLDSAVEAATLTFEGDVSGGGQSTEFTYTGGVQNPGAVVNVLTSSLPISRVNAGDLIQCGETGVLLPYSQVISKGASSLSLDKMADPTGSPATAFAGTTYAYGTDSIINIGPIGNAAFNTSYLKVGRKLRDAASGEVLTITNIYTSNGDTQLAVTGGGTAGSRQYRFVFSFSVTAGVSPAQTVSWTAEQIIAGTGEQKVTSVRIINGGRNYSTPPSVLVRGGGNGYGLSVVPTVESGKVTSLQVVDPGRAYTAQPELYTDSSSATASPVMRPALRGKYRCAYRFVDRTETVVSTTRISDTRGDAPTTITVESASGLAPGMLLESPVLPNGTKILSVSGSTLEISQQIQAEGRLREIVIENGGDGYAEGETPTVTLPAGANATASVAMTRNPSGSYSVDSVAVTVIAYNAATTRFFGVGKIPVTFAPPAGGGTPATGYGIFTTLRATGDYVANRTVVVRDMRKPISYSNFSPITDVDTGPNETRQHASLLEWKLPGVSPPSRADLVELWRTSSDQSLVFYRLEAYGKPSSSGVEIVGTDTLTDEELFDPDRANYAAMPVVLPNGSVNAYRFGVPRTDMSVCVAFQDRLWYGVSTSGKDANTLFYSEFDEFESCPDVNDLPIQNNQRSTDSLTALVPFGSMLLAMQHSHTYAITYNTDPGVDASIQMLSHRGCLHQRCWDIYENVIYAADETGIYAMSRTGEVAAISAPIRDYFNSELIDFSKRDTFFLSVCPRTGVLRFFCCLTTQTAPTPTFAICYDIDRKAWWTERYPNSFCSAVTGRPGAERINSSIFGATDGGLYEFTADKDHTNQTVVRCEIRSLGSGYKRSPKITCPNSEGVQLKGVVSEGRLVDVLVYSSGWNCKWGVQLLTEDGRALAGHDGKNLKLVEYAPIELDIEPPTPGGEQATAVAHFSVTTRLARDVTVAAGESFVRINSVVTNPIDTTVPPLIATEGGDLLSAVGGALDDVPLQVEPPAVEIGMEAIGDYLPLNCFVSKIIGQDIYLAHPDGTPVVTLGGAARTDGNGDGYKESGGSQTIVYFRKPYYTHIPFRLATGALQLINEDNAKGGDNLVDRSVALVYSPTESDKEVEIVEYFNDSTSPRPNVMRRSRGGPLGFEHRQDSASTVLNTSRYASALGEATGVARAMFASRTKTDATGEDQHVQVELFGRPASANGGADRTPQKFVMHSMTINGVIEDAE